MDILAQLNWVDATVLLIILASVILAVRRGGIFEIILLIGLATAFLGGYLICEWAVFSLKHTGIWEWAIKLVSFPTSFLIIYVIFSSIAEAVAAVLHEIKVDSAWLDIGDGLFGIALGLLRAFAFVSLLYLGIVTLYGSDIPAPVRAAYSMPWIERTVNAGNDFYHRPNGAMKQLRHWVEYIRPPTDDTSPLQEENQLNTDDGDISFNLSNERNIIWRS